MYRSTWRRAYLVSLSFLLMNLLTNVSVKALTPPASAKEAEVATPKLWTAIGAEHKAQVLLPITVVGADPEKHLDNPPAFTPAIVGREFASLLAAYRVGNATFVAPRQWSIVSYSTASNGSTALTLANALHAPEHVSFVIGRANEKTPDALVVRLFPNQYGVKNQDLETKKQSFSVVQIRPNVKAFSRTLQNGWTECGLAEVEWEGVYVVVKMTLSPDDTALGSTILHDFAGRYPSLSQFAKP